MYKHCYSYTHPYRECCSSLNYDGARNVQSSPSPPGVAHILSDLGGVRDVVPLMAAILHDTIEDTRTIEAELKAEFGLEVAAVVMECSDDKSLVKARRKELQIEKVTASSMGVR